MARHQLLAGAGLADDQRVGLDGMSTFEGPMMAIKTVNALSHYTDWTIGHVHAGALGWVAMITIGSLYHLIPKVYGVEKMHSVGLINAHFWLATIGTVLYIASLWVNGITQGLMWRAVNEDGTLTYSFVVVSSGMRSRFSPANWRRIVVSYSASSIAGSL